MSKVCNIDSGNIVNGSKLFYNTTLANWNSPLDKLENSYEMFAYSQLGDFRTHDGEQAGTYGCYTEFASLSDGQRMFSHTSPRFHGGRVAFPSLVNGTKMFEGADLGIRELERGKVTMYAPKLTDGTKIFYNSNAESIYFYLASNANGVVMDEAFAYAKLGCGIEVNYANTISSAKNMFKNADCELINLRYDGANVHTYCNCASMFEGAILDDYVFITDQSGYYSGGYYYGGSYNVNCLGDENFFTNLFHLWKITDASNMFKDFSASPPYSSLARFDIKETLQCDGYCCDLKNCSKMFTNSGIFGDVTIINDLFGGETGYGFSAECMFYGSIPEDTYNHYVEIGGTAFLYCYNALGMFGQCTGLTSFTLIGRKTLCSDFCRMRLGSFPNGDSMFEGCTNLRIFETRTDNNSQIEYGYHKVSSGENCFSGCKLDNETSLRCAYQFLSECADATIGLDDQWATDVEGATVLQNLFGSKRPTTVTHNGGKILRFEYN